jgi:hypothetical protein
MTTQALSWLFPADSWAWDESSVIIGHPATHSLLYQSSVRTVIISHHATHNLHASLTHIAWPLFVGSHPRLPVPTFAQRSRCLWCWLPYLGPSCTRMSTYRQSASPTAAARFVLRAPRVATWAAVTRLIARVAVSPGFGWPGCIWTLRQVWGLWVRTPLAGSGLSSG